jgi:DNA polymerase III alpha subunit
MSCNTNKNKKTNKKVSFTKKTKLLLSNNEKLEQIYQNIKRDIPKTKQYRKRLYKELKLIQKNKFEKCFLHVIEILKFSKDFPHVIRGSAGSSLLCYLIGITNFDPIKENIVLSRFMHKNRQDMPDIDIDVPWYIHKYMFQKVYENWGDKAARISNHVMYSEKSAIRESIRDEGHRKFVPKNFNLKKIFDNNEVIDRVYKRTSDYIGTFRCYSQHCGGVVILEESIPKEYLLEKKSKQLKFNKDDVEKRGLIKIDILSNRGLGQLWDIEKRNIIDYDYNDKNIYDLFGRGNNIGITFGESPAMRKLFRVNKPKSIKELAEQLALVRPAASKSKQYINSIYPETNDVKQIMYDDDGTLQIKNLLKCSDSVAEVYRKAFSKKNEPLIREFSKKISNHVDRFYIIKNLRNLKWYSFCKSHAYSYAQLLYCLGYQKYYNPQKFWVSAINNCHSTYKKWVYYSEANNSGLELFIGTPPWKIVNNKMLMKEKKCDRRFITNDLKDFKKYGYWTSKKFIGDTYFIEEGDTVKFRGLIALYRKYVNEKSDNVTFITIGYDFGKYIDISISDMIRVSGYDIIEGVGIYRNFTLYCDDYKLIKL